LGKQKEAVSQETASFLLYVGPVLTGDGVGTFPDDLAEMNGVGVALGVDEKNFRILVDF
jgi:hypothetical protein